MEVDEAIRSRSSVKKFLDRTVSRELIEECLNLAVWAPNHRLTEPWRFCVVTGSGRERLADAVSVQATPAAPRTAQLVAAVKASIAGDTIRRKLMSAPAVIVVYSLHGSDETTTQENLAATAAAVQNLLLGAHHLGLATIWRTADYFSGHGVRRFLQIPAEADFVAAVYLGYSDQRETPRKRTPAAQCTAWFQE